MSTRIGKLEEMKMRDEIALHALRLFQIDREDMSRWERGISPRHEWVAKFCYDVADAFLAERKKRI